MKKRLTHRLCIRGYADIVRGLAREPASALELSARHDVTESVMRGIVKRLHTQGVIRIAEWRQPCQGPADAGIAGRGSPELRGLFGPLARVLTAASTPWEWPTEPTLLRTIHGVSTRLDRCRVKALGNSVVPLIPELIGRVLMECYA